MKLTIVTESGEEKVIIYDAEEFDFDDYENSQEVIELIQEAIKVLAKK